MRPALVAALLLSGCASTDQALQYIVLDPGECTSKKPPMKWELCPASRDIPFVFGCCVAIPKEAR